MTLQEDALLKETWEPGNLAGPRLSFSALLFKVFYLEVSGLNL